MNFKLCNVTVFITLTRVNNNRANIMSIEIKFLFLVSGAWRGAGSFTLRSSKNKRTKTKQNGSMKIIYTFNKLSSYKLNT